MWKRSVNLLETEQFTDRHNRKGLSVGHSILSLGQKAAQVAPIASQSIVGHKLASFTACRDSHWICIKLTVAVVSVRRSLHSPAGKESCPSCSMMPATRQWTSPRSDARSLMTSARMLQRSRNAASKERSSNKLQQSRHLLPC